MITAPGMLWYDKEGSLEERIARASAYYQKKYSQIPTVCQVNPKTLGATAPTLPGMTIEPSRYILPNHFWLGVEVV